MDWASLLKISNQSYYTEPILAATSLCCCIICIRFRSESKSTLFLCMHAFSSFLVVFFCKIVMPLFYNFHLSLTGLNYLYNSFSIMFTQIELICVLSYVKINLSSSRHSITLTIIFAAMALHTALYVILNFPLKQVENTSIYITESIFLVFIL
jgi:hypothetical protein